VNKGFETTRREAPNSAALVWFWRRSCNSGY
jgi:hypothetical protein